MNKIFRQQILNTKCTYNTTHTDLYIHNNTHTHIYSPQARLKNVAAKFMEYGYQVNERNTETTPSTFEMLQLYPSYMLENSVASNIRHIK